MLKYTEVLGKQLDSNFVLVNFKASILLPALSIDDRQQTLADNSFYSCHWCRVIETTDTSINIRQFIPNQIIDRLMVSSKIRRLNKCYYSPCAVIRSPAFCC